MLTPASRMVVMERKEHSNQRTGGNPPLGEFIATQRRAAELSLRQVAERAGISNPYVSQIERGLRKPSAEVLAQLANALQVSAETLYEKAGLLEGVDRVTPVERAVLADSVLSETQKQALLEVYQAFVSPQSTTNKE